MLRLYLNGVPDCDKMIETSAVRILEPTMKFWRVFVLFPVLGSLLLIAGPVQSATPGQVVANSGYGLDLSGESDRATGEATSPSDLLALGIILPKERSRPFDSIEILSSTVPSGTVVLSTRVYSGTLAPIAAHIGTSMQAVLSTNKLYNPGLVLMGQRILSPGGNASPTPPPITGKWIDVDIGSQTTTAYQGKAPLKTVLVSTGTAWHPTPLGSFKVYLKVASQTMSGGVGADRYYYTGVPWIMYFSGDVGFHGTYWHNNFGVPMSHGCVNLSVQDAKWLYNWGAVGMPVVVHE